MHTPTCSKGARHSPNATNSSRVLPAAYSTKSLADPLATSACEHLGRRSRHLGEPPRGVVVVVQDQAREPSTEPPDQLDDPGPVAVAQQVELAGQVDHRRPGAGRGEAQDVGQACQASRHTSRRPGPTCSNLFWDKASKASSPRTRLAEQAVQRCGHWASFPADTGHPGVSHARAARRGGPTGPCRAAVEAGLVESRSETTASCALGQPCHPFDRPVDGVAGSVRGEAVDHTVVHDRPRVRRELPDPHGRRLLREHRHPVVGDADRAVVVEPQGLGQVDRRHGPPALVVLHEHVDPATSVPPPGLAGQAAVALQQSQQVDGVSAAQDLQALDPLVHLDQRHVDPLGGDRSPVPVELGDQRARGLRAGMPSLDDDVEVPAGLVVGDVLDVGQVRRHCDQPRGRIGNGQARVEARDQREVVEDHPQPPLGANHATALQPLRVKPALPALAGQHVGQQVGELGLSHDLQRPHLAHVTRRNGPRSSRQGPACEGL